LKPEFNGQAAFQTLHLHSALERVGRTKGISRLLDLQEFRSQCQNFRLAGNPAKCVAEEKTKKSAIAMMTDFRS
jgi:hypothetical protein